MSEGMHGRHLLSDKGEKVRRKGCQQHLHLSTCGTGILNGESVWEWVCKSDWEETLLEYSRQEKWYDPFLNEWDCCHEWGSGPGDAEDNILYIDIQPPAPEERLDTAEESQPEAEPDISPPLVAELNIEDTMLPPAPMEQYKDPNEEQVQCEVLKMLTEYFGFIPPIPFPSSFNRFTSDSDFKSLLVALRVHGIQLSNTFFKTLTGKLCGVFLQSFTGRSDKLPESNLWDLSTDNRWTLCFSGCLSSIRIVKNKSQTLYMFEPVRWGTIPWKIAVLSASAALYVCHLPEDMSEEELAWELV
ncbi:hypothetical protein P691DRAFT_781918 [Macrolepiota fuliginosa MF-IS2]|uniref:Uncharacterized protein n=1 Tax=Macrolepiota fuliginosa MF-IS2 TaxID=1400762 RepID=A0A9P5WZH7_9AGAR|nr:hypothetical protein P691DRAFT_781918 [Macrolepiota fuliginosa MF-IS2]